MIDGMLQRDIFSTRYQPRIQHSLLNLKNRLFILILGAYFPTDVQDRLIRLKSCLQKEGYSNAFLVKDLSDPPKEPGEEDDEYIARKSHFWLGRANVLLFIFFCKGKNEGVATELGLATEMLQPRLVKRAVFYEERCVKKLSRMITGIPKLALMDQYYFSNDDTLCRKARTACFQALHSLFSVSTW